MAERTDLWLGLEPLLIARLQAKLPDGVQVIPARDLAGVAEQAQFAPAVQIYAGPYRPLDDSQLHSRQHVEQTWYAVVVVRNAQDPLAGSAARAEASPICDAVVAALIGWTPPVRDFNPLQLAPAPIPRWSPGGIGYYPIGFKTSFYVRSIDVRTS